MVDVKSYFNKTYDSLYQKVTSFVIAKCSNIVDVEDIVQEVFIELYDLVNKKGTAYITNPEALVMQITKFKLHKHYRSGEKRKYLIPFYNNNEEGEEYEIPLPIDIEIDDNLINNETLSEVWKILQEKSQDIQKIFGLYFYCDNTIKEISQYLELSESAVKHKLYRTLAEIRKIYKKDVVSL